jgi:hypothetical protein
MEEGLLWFDNDAKRTVEEKVRQAATRYAEKFHPERPNVCFVNPTEVEGQELGVDGITVRPLRSILPHHFWIGREENAQL